MAFLFENNGLYAWTCVSWKMNRIPIEERSCKQIDQFLNDKDDEEYIVDARRAAAMRKAGMDSIDAPARSERLSSSRHPQVIREMSLQLHKISQSQLDISYGTRHTSGSHGRTADTMLLA